MGLRGVHLLFISLATLLAAFLAVWALTRYQAEGSTAHVVIGVLSIVGAVALVVYAVRFRRKSRQW